MARGRARAGGSPGQPRVRSATHTLDERISAADGRFGPAQKRVVAFLSERREDVAFLSAADIGAILQVSDATVIRTTQGLGYEGLSDLKAELRETLRQRVAGPVRYARSIEFLSNDNAEILDHLLADQVDSLNEARRTLRVADYRRAVELVAAADRVVVHGSGPQDAIGEYLAQMLRRFGRHALVLHGAGAPLVDVAMELRGGDVLLVIAYERSSPELETVLGLARRRRVPVVLVTDTLALALNGRHTVALVARRGSPSAATTITVPLVIVEALILGVATADRERTLGALAEIRQLRARMGVG